MKSNPRIEFDSATHTYKIANVYGVYQTTPSVTSILKKGGAYPTWKFKKHHADRGTAVHLATQYYDEGDLDESSLSPSIIGYFNAYKKFRQEIPIKIEGREIMVYSEENNYAGTIDIVANVGGRWTVFDIKTGRPSSATPVQTAAYALALSEDHALCDTFNVASMIDRAAIHLGADGRYKVHKYTDSEDFEAWLGLLRWIKYMDKEK